MDNQSLFQSTKHWQAAQVELVGWIYTLAWSLSFYGQILSNHRTKNVQGLNLDYLALNVCGFLFYSTYNSYGYFFNQDQTGEVDFNDVLFSYHALFATLLTCSQVCLYSRGINRVHLSTKIFISCLFLIIFVYGTVTALTAGKQNWVARAIDEHPRMGIFGLMGYYKLVISLIKYIPQIYFNYRRQSTEGWSICNVVLDMTGGIFSFLQMLLEKVFEPSTYINTVKILLGGATIAYDTIFLLQHFVWYRKAQGGVSIEQWEEMENSE